MKPKTANTRSTKHSSVRLADNEQLTSKGADDVNVEKVTVWFEEAVDVLGEWVGHWKRHRKHHLGELVEVVGKVCM
jgi:hypothetical protein